MKSYLWAIHEIYSDNLIMHTSYILDLWHVPQDDMDMEGPIVAHAKYLTGFMGLNPHL